MALRNAAAKFSTTAWCGLPGAGVLQFYPRDVQDSVVGELLGVYDQNCLSNFTASVSWRYIVDDKGLKGLDAYRSTIR